MHTVIPVEIVDHILGLLHPDHATLETCSVVFPQIVDRHLYSYIALHTRPFTDLSNDTKQSKDAYYVVDPIKFASQLVNRWPHLGFCVRGVRIIIHVNPQPGSEDLTEYHLAWEMFPYIYAILEAFSRVESIEVTTDTFLWPWRLLYPYFLEAIRKKFRFRFVTIYDCEYLRKVIRRELEDEYLEPLWSCSVRSQPKVTKMLSWVKQSALHTLSLRMQMYLDLLTCQPLIQACSRTLVNLDLQFDSCAGTPWGQESDLDITYIQLPALKTLTLRSPVTFTTELAFVGHFSALPAFIPLLKALSTSSPDSVHLSLHLHFLSAPISLPEASNWPDIIFIDGIPVFQKPIEIHARVAEEPDELDFSVTDVLPLFEQDPDIKKLLEDGKLITIADVD